MSYYCHYDERQWTFVNEVGPANTLTRTGAGCKPGANVTIPCVILLQRSLARAATKIQVEDSFWTQYIPQDDALSRRHVGGVVTTPWVSTLRTLASTNEAARLAIGALAFASLGRLHGDEWYLRQGTRLYARALPMLNQALQQPSTATSDATLACCRTLSFYERFRKDEDEEPSQGSD